MHCPHCYQRQAFDDSMSPCFTFCPFFQDFTFVFQILRPSELGGGFVPARAFHSLGARGWQSVAGNSAAVETTPTGRGIRGREFM